MISKKLSEMEEQQLHSNDERGRLRTENAVLTERVHVLEEQMLVAEQRYKEQLQEEKNRTRELLQRMEREKQLETESLTLKYQMLEKDLQSAKKEADKAREETQRMQETVEELRGQLTESKLLVEDLEEERIKLERQFKRYGLNRMTRGQQGSHTAGLVLSPGTGSVEKFYGRFYQALAQWYHSYVLIAQQYGN
ncbi:hypothetical protein ANCDUO_18855 [Ancylostoma duodenale]|uniref:Rab11-FIP3/4 domain-containing protein n=1 Tax=Ancylostoma duodenale TaxID=51022 RepID=A0A0C2CMS3_9BILA|nr:hypothetical protein ANCDUO_18855 [Ancylostoma duodenale]